MLNITKVPYPVNDFENNIDGFKNTYENKDFKVKLNGQEVVCYNTRCSAVPFNRAFDGSHQRQIEQTELLGLVSFEADEDVVVEVESVKAFARALVRPLSKNISTVTNGNKVTLRLSTPGQYCLELDDEHTCLNLFYNPVKKFGSEKEYTKYYGPGLHVEGFVKLQSGDRVYIDKDAIIWGGIYGRDVEDVIIEGYGMVDGCILSRTNNHCRGIFMLHNCRNIKVDGIILSDSPFWVCAVYNCENLEINNLKITGQWRYNSDGIDIVNCRNVSITNSFIHAFDDVIVLKGYAFYDAFTIDFVENIRVDNCILWCNWGRSIEIGIETFDKEHRHISFTNCDLIHNSASAIDIQNGNCAHVHDVIVKNINVEFQRSTMPEIYQFELDQKYDGYGKIAMPYLIVIDNHRYTDFLKSVFSEEVMAKVYAYTVDEENFGQVSEVLIDNINIYVEEGLPNFKVKVFSDDPENSFENITISNIYVNGEKVTNTDKFDLCIDERLKNFKLFE